MKRSDRRLLAAVVVALALAAICWFFVNKFVDSSQLQDCVMSGRKNCVQVDDPHPR